MGILATLLGRPSAATTVSQRLNYGGDSIFGETNNVSGEYVDESTALNCSAVYGAYNLISSSMMTLPFVLYERTGTDSRKRAVDHPVYELLHDSPNPEMSAASFVRVMYYYALSWGNGYAEIEWNQGRTRPLALWPISSDRVKPKRVQGTGELVYLVRNYHGTDVAIPASDMIHVSGMGWDGVQGYSVVGYARNTIGLNLAAEKFGGAFFGNGAKPGGVLEHPAKLTTEAHQRLRDSWNKIHQGSSNSSKVAVLEDGMKYHPLTMPPEDAQFLETRRFGIEEVCRWFNLPPHKLRDLTRATFSNIEHQALEYVSDTLMPWMVAGEQEFARKLLTVEDRKKYYAKFNANGLLRGDIQSRFNAYAVGLLNGFMNPDDCRRLEDMDPLPNGAGKVFIRPTNAAPAESFMSDVAVVGGQQVEDPEDSPEDSMGALIPALADPIERMDRKAKNHIERAKSKPKTEYVTKIAAFFDDHKADMLAAVVPALESARALSRCRDEAGWHVCSKRLVNDHVSACYAANRDGDDDVAWPNPNNTARAWLAELAKV